MGMDLSNFIGKDHRYLENAHRFTHYLELKDRLTLGRDQDQKRIVDAFLRFVGDRNITVVKTDNGVVEEVVDVSQYDIGEQLLLLENDEGFFYDDDYEKRLEEMEDDRYLMIPARLPQDNFEIMEMFVYKKIQKTAIAEKFYRVLEGKKPFRNFKDLLFDYPDLREQWFVYKDRYFRNETINWLCSNNIELVNQHLIQEIEIQELTTDEINDLPDEIKDFSPVRCMNCHNEKGFAKRLFMINVSPENKLIEQETKQIMKEKFNITHYGWWSGKTPNILTVSRCPKCTSEHIIWDY